MKKMIMTGLAILASATLHLAALASTGFRGNGDGEYDGVKPPLRWSPETNVVWTTPLEFSNACPVVVGRKIFICEEPDTLLAIDMDDGKILWKASNSYADVGEQADKPLPKTHKTNGYSSPTPVTDGKAVYMVFCTGVVTGFDLDGRRLWGRVLPATPHHNGWGHSASPRLVDGILLVHYGNTLFALDARTGRDKWVATSDSGWGTPLVTTLDKDTVVVTPSGDIFAVENGKKLASGCFKFPWNAPVVKDGILYKVDEDGANAFDFRVNENGKLPEVWNTAGVPKGRYYATSVVHDGLVYNVSQKSELIVLDAKDGSIVYTQALQFGGTAYPSPILAGGRIYISSDTGKTAVIKPGRTYEMLAENQFHPFRTCPVFVGDKMLIRANDGLYCIQEK